MNIFNLADRVLRKTKHNLFRLSPARLFQPRVLVVGIYLANKKNLVRHIVQELHQSKKYRITQRWTAIGGPPPAPHVARVTVDLVGERVPKSILINRLLKNIRLDAYDFVLLLDDDIQLPERFVDQFLALQTRHDFTLAQPARTPNSCIDHAIVRQVPGVMARRTRFVEVGPVVSMRRDIAKLLLPLDERSPMGWGLDFVWPVIVERHHLRMGIIDDVPIEHSVRPAVAHYAHEEASAAMENYLAQVPHFSPEEAFQVIEVYR